MVIDGDLKRALLHEAGHAVAYYLLQHRTGGIAVLKKDLVFCNIAAPDSPQEAVAAGSAAELLILGGYDRSGAGADQKDLAISETDYDGLVRTTVPLLSPHKRKIRRIQSHLLRCIRWRQSLDDFPPIDWAAVEMQPPKDGNTYSLIMSVEEISEAMTQE
jgi:hypothetical protein